MARPRAIDVGRLGEALARPGMDTRTWLIRAEVVRTTTVTGGDEAGMYADVLLFYPDRAVEETALVGCAYSGPGFGVWAELHPGDEVLVAMPNGDPDEGPVIVTRLWSAGEPPPGEAGSGYVIKAREGARVRIIADGADIVLETRGAGKVRLGHDSGAAIPTDEIVHGSGIDPFTGLTYWTLNNTSAVVTARKE